VYIKKPHKRQVRIDKSLAEVRRLPVLGPVIVGRRYHDLVSIGGRDGSYHVPVDGTWHDETVVVVGVFPDLQHA
jgi:hypothetical protein